MRILVSLFFIFCIFFIGCNTTAPQTYEQGLEECMTALKTAHGDMESWLVAISRDCMVGASFPEFTALTIDGKTINPSYFKGKVTVVNFWFTTCPPCVSEIPDFNRIATEFGTEKVNYLAIGRDTDEDIIEFLKENPWQFDHIAGRKLIEEVSKIMWGYPTTFVLNKKGIIVAGLGGLSRTDEQDILSPIIRRELAH